MPIDDEPYADPIRISLAGIGAKRKIFYFDGAIRQLALLLFLGLCITTLAAGMPANAALQGTNMTSSGAQAQIDIPGAVSDFHGYTCHQLTVDGCSAYLVEPKAALPGRPWVWRTMFWDAFSNADVALLARGYYVAFIDVGDTFGCPDAMKHFDVFYDQMTSSYGLSKKTALEGLSRGGLYAFRWAYVNTDKVDCIYADAPVCDMKSWPGAKGKAIGDAAEWQKAMQCYHFTSEQQMMDFKGNPIDILAPIAAARIPIIDVCGDSDVLVPAAENSFIVHDRYVKMHGPIVMIVKEGCDHHPHGLADPTPIVNFIVAHTAEGPAAEEAAKTALKPGAVVLLPKGQW